MVYQTSQLIKKNLKPLYVYASYLTISVLYTALCILGFSNIFPAFALPFNFPYNEFLTELYYIQVTFEAIYSPF